MLKRKYILLDAYDILLYIIIYWYITLHYIIRIITYYTHTRCILYIDNFINIFLDNYIIQSVCDYLK